MSPEAAPTALGLRAPALAWGLGGLALVHAVGLFVATLAAMAAVQASWRVAEGLSAPAVMATVLTAVELGPKLRRGQIQTYRQGVIGAARAWGAVGAAWPFAWAVMAAAEGVSGNWGLEALRVLAGGLIGAGAGAAGGALAGRLVLVRA